MPRNGFFFDTYGSILTSRRSEGSPATTSGQRDLSVFSSPVDRASSIQSPPLLYSIDIGHLVEEVWIYL